MNRKDIPYDQRHGGPFDRGSADSYYGRGIQPHYFLGDTYSSPKVDEKHMTQDEITLMVELAARK